MPTVKNVFMDFEKQKNLYLDILRSTYKQPSTKNRVLQFHLFPWTFTYDTIIMSYTPGLI